MLAIGRNRDGRRARIGRLPGCNEDPDDGSGRRRTQRRAPEVVACTRGARACGARLRHSLIDRKVRAHPFGAVGGYGLACGLDVAQRDDSGAK